MKLQTIVLPAFFTALVLSAAGCGSNRKIVKTHTGEQGEVIIAEGMAPIVDNKVLDAKQAALADAQKNAVSMVVGVYVTAKTIVQKALTIESDIIAKTQGYITHYDVLSEKKDAGFYHIKIKAVVRLEDISKDLKTAGILDMEEPAPGVKAVVIISEIIDGKKAESLDAQAAVVGELIKKNFIIKDYSGVSAKQMEEISDGGTGLLQKIAQQSQADLVIAGSAESGFFTDQNLGGFISYRASINAKAVKAEAGEIAASVSNIASGVDVNRQIAAKKSLAKAGELLGAELAVKIGEQLKKSSSVAVIIDNVKDLNTANEIINHIRQAGFVKKVVLDSFKMEQINLNVILNSEDSKKLSEIIEAYKGASVSVLSISKYQINAQVK